MGLMCVSMFGIDSLLESPLKENYRILSVFGEKEFELNIQAILNDKVLIHNKWYGIGDKIGIFHIHKVTSNEVILIDKKSEQKTIKLKRKIL